MGQGCIELRQHPSHHHPPLVGREIVGSLLQKGRNLVLEPTAACLGAAQWWSWQPHSSSSPSLSKFSCLLIEISAERVICRSGKYIYCSPMASLINTA